MTPHPLLRFVLVAALPVKLIGVSAYYIVYVIMVPSGEKKRRNHVDHARDVLKKERRLNPDFDPEKQRSIEEKLTLLERNIETGWRTGEEVGAFIEVLKFSFGTDAYNTGVEFHKLADTHIAKPIVSAWDDLTQWTGAHIAKPASNFFDQLGQV